MSKHIGTIGSKITAEVTLINEYCFDNHFGYRTTKNYIYTMKDDEGNILVWKTTSNLVSWNEAKEEDEAIFKGDRMQISGTVKEHGEYKGTAQTVLSRCKFSLISRKAVEIAKQKPEEAQKNLGEGDQILEMPYRQYKQHYSDCETVSGSYDDRYNTIKVIIRAGRLKNSGVRGQHFRAYQLYLVNSKGEEKYCTYRAVSFENAVKQHLKECKKSGWTPVYENGEVKLGRIFL